MNKDAVISINLPVSTTGQNGNDFLYTRMLDLSNVQHRAVSLQQLSVSLTTRRCEIYARISFVYVARIEPRENVLCDEMRDGGA